jgi:hypothetical protein
MEEVPGKPMQAGHFVGFFIKAGFYCNFTIDILIN